MDNLYTNLYIFTKEIKPASNRIVIQTKHAMCTVDIEKKMQLGQGMLTVYLSTYLIVFTIDTI